jgi:hypothetical protein
MTKVICPHCNSVADHVSLINGRKVYCARCGWNLAITQQELRSAQKIALGIASLGVVLAAIARVRNPGEWSGPVTLLVALSGVPLLYVIYAFRQLRKLKHISAVNRVRTTSVPKEASLSHDSPQTSDFGTQRYPELVRLARPRKVKMIWRGRLFSILAVGAITLYSYLAVLAISNEFGNLGTRPGGEWALFLWGALIFGCSFVFFRNRLRERELLANGEIATGYIIKQTNGRYSQTAEYNFQSGAGETQPWVRIPPSPPYF